MQGFTWEIRVISDSTTLQEQLNEIRYVDARLVVVDSISMLEEFRTGSDAMIKKIINGYRQVCNELGCHIIFLSQLTKNKTARGSTTLPHLVDIEFLITKEAVDGFAMKVVKNRYGKSGTCSWWTHYPYGAVCSENFRREDREWCNITGEKFRDIQAEADAFLAEINKKNKIEMLKMQYPILGRIVAPFIS